MTFVIWSLFSGGLLGRCWLESGQSLFPQGSVYSLLQVCLELLPEFWSFSTRQRICLGNFFVLSLFFFSSANGK